MNFGETQSVDFAFQLIKIVTSIATFYITCFYYMVIIITLYQTCPYGNWTDANKIN